MISVERQGDYIVTEEGELFKKMEGNINTTGYIRVWFNNRSELLHRIVAMFYHGSPGDRPCVNHKDGDKLNNKPSNLEWCTYKENSEHAIDTGLVKRTPIVGYNENNYFIFATKDEASKAVKVCSGNIGRALRGERETCGGLRWRFATQEEVLCKPCHKIKSNQENEARKK